MLIGVQLYSARNYLTSDEGIDAAFRKSAETGYACVQYSGAPDGGNFRPETLKKVIEKYRLPVKLTHVSFDRLLHDTDGEIQKHIAIGCRNIGLGMLPMRCVTDMAALDEFTENVRAVIRRLKKNGCSFFYHNHSIEFYRLPSGVTLFEYLLEKIPDLNITLDVHWVQRGGADVLRTIERCAGRLECVHLKDYAVNEKGEPMFAPVGEGNLDWKTIMPALEKAGAKYAFVEQDDAPDRGDPFDCLKKSRENLAKMGY